MVGIEDSSRIVGESCKGQNEWMHVLVLDGNFQVKIKGKRFNYIVVYRPEMHIIAPVNIPNFAFNALVRILFFYRLVILTALVSISGC